MDGLLRSVPCSSLFCVGTARSWFHQYLVAAQRSQAAMLSRFSVLSPPPDWVQPRHLPQAAQPVLPLAALRLLEVAPQQREGVWPPLHALDLGAVELRLACPSHPYRSQNLPLHRLAG